MRNGRLLAEEMPNRLMASHHTDVGTNFYICVFPRFAFGLFYNNPKALRLISDHYLAKRGYYQSYC